MEIGLVACSFYNNSQSYIRNQKYNLMSTLNLRLRGRCELSNFKWFSEFYNFPKVFLGSLFDSFSFLLMFLCRLKNRDV